MKGQGRSALPHVSCATAWVLCARGHMRLCGIPRTVRNPPSRLHISICTAKSGKRSTPSSCRSAHLSPQIKQAHPHKPVSQQVGRIAQSDEAHGRYVVDDHVSFEDGAAAQRSADHLVQVVLEGKDEVQPVRGRVCAGRRGWVRLV